MLGASSLAAIDDTGGSPALPWRSGGYSGDRVLCPVTPAFRASRLGPASPVGAVAVWRIERRRPRRRASGGLL